MPPPAQQQRQQQQSEQQQSEQPAGAPPKHDASPRAPAAAAAAALGEASKHGPSPPYGMLVKLRTGKRICRSKVLTQKVAQMHRQHDTLRKQNEALRAKEAMQRQLLCDYDSSLHHLALLLVQCADRAAAAAGGAASSDEQESLHELALVKAAMVDLQAQELLQQLQQHATTDSERDGSGSSQQHEAMAAAAAAAGSEPPSSESPHASGGSPTPGTPGNTSSGSTTGGSGGSSGSSVVAPQAPRSNTARYWAAITPDDVLGMRGITPAQLADLYKSGVRRIALMKLMGQQQHPLYTHLTDTLEAAVDAFGRLVMLAMVAADDTLLQLSTINLDTGAAAAAADGEVADMPPDMWARVVAAAAMQPEQRRQVRLGFDIYMQQRAPLLQRQAGIVQQLQALLQPEESPPGSAAGAWDSGRLQGLSHAGGGPAPLSFEAATAAEELLQQLARVVRLHREASRRLVITWMNLLTHQQHAEVLLASYPFTTRVPACTALVWEQETQQQQQQQS